ncbi:heavy metal-associated isoprenylated plant protein 47-like isoform X2 [Citrus sinensis]|uniref:HMA domain-containing protein n=1 Tax=Citrus sinensis TaxID=2711 RepID=A0A067DB12_CITSI|nr:heavy metal-associated isoprenylated plant protein 47-like [Citrus x clementina]XP_052291550.1 heavy metal-associated isoprenylated plant protein 47-like isoform X2 [Citrus sinensis]KDO38735.1 hypothetical protein CISIN_1g047835mg [Citrus sinensis]
MRKKILYRLDNMHSPKCRTKAFKIIAGFPGLLSVAMKGDDLRHMEVIGDIDEVALANMLRRKIGYVETMKLDILDGRNQPAIEPEVPQQPFPAETPCCSIM